MSSIRFCYRTSRPLVALLGNKKISEHAVYLSMYDVHLIYHLLNFTQLSQLSTYYLLVHLNMCQHLYLYVWSYDYESSTV